MPYTVSPSLQRITAIGVFVFFSTLFVVRSGHSWAAVILLLSSIWMLAGRPALALTREDRALSYALLVYGVVMIAMTLYLGNRPREMDHPARALLTIPILLLLLRVPVRQTILWAGIIIGVVLSAVLSFWEIYVQRLDRAAGYLNPIHFGEYALVFSACCVAGLIWAQTQERHAYKWRVALVLGMLCGLCSMVLSGSRGAWVTLPVLLVVLAGFAFMRLSRRHLLYGVFAAMLSAAVLAALFARPGSVLHQRYEDAVYDMAQYRQHNTATSIGARVDMWRAAAINGARRPVLGWNMQAYWAALEDLVREGRVNKFVMNFKDNLHNTYIHAWIFFGLPGLLALLVLFGVPLWYFARRLRDPDPAVCAVALCGTLFMTAYLCFSLTQSMLMHSSGIMFFMLTLAIFWGALRHARGPRIATESPVPVIP